MSFQLTGETQPTIPFQHSQNHVCGPLMPVSLSLSKLSLKSFELFRFQIEGLKSTILCYSIVHYIMLCYTILCYTIIYCHRLYYTIPCPSSHIHVSNRSESNLCLRRRMQSSSKRLAGVRVYLRESPTVSIRPISKLRIYNSGIRVKLILKQRRWAFLVHRLIS